MSTARVDDIEVLKMFRAQLFKFAEACSVALGDAESDIRRTQGWLENEQITKWQNEHRKRQRLLGEAKEKLRMKQVFSGAGGTRQSTVDEEKAVKVAMARLQEAEMKITACKQWSRRLQKEMLTYKGQTQRFATSTTVDIPLAAAVLWNMIIRLEAYASIAPANATSAVGGESSGSMTREAGEAASFAQLLQKLRDSTPGMADRVGAAMDNIDLAGGSPERISDEDRASLKTLAKTDEPPLADGATLVISTSTAGKPRVYLQRLQPVKESDSGWYLAPATVGANPFNIAMSIRDVLKVRPDWLELLSLPVGSLVVVDAGAVAAVIDTDGNDRWGALLDAKLEEALTEKPDAAADAEPVPNQQPADAQSPQEGVTA